MNRTIFTGLFLIATLAACEDSENSSRANGGGGHSSGVGSAGGEGGADAGGAHHDPGGRGGAAGNSPTAGGGADGGGGHSPTTDGGANDGGANNGGANDGGANDGGSPSNHGIDVQMNDVSILFPLVDAAAQIEPGYLSASSVGSRGVLLPQAFFDETGGLHGRSINPDCSDCPPVARWADLKVLAMRIDPCFADLAPDPHGSQCENQLRLVVQELLPEGGSPKTISTAAHLFYSLTREELLSLARELVALRKANAPGARLGHLQPHPVMVQQGLSGPMAAGVRALILKYAGAQNLKRMALTDMPKLNVEWEFHMFQLKSLSPLEWQRVPIPAIVGQRLDLSTTVVSAFGPDRNGFFTPDLTDADNLALFANAANTAAATAEQRHQRFDSLVKIENPSKHSPNTIDCGSCHMTAPFASELAKAPYLFTRAGSVNAYVSDARFVLPSELTPTMDTTGGNNLHAFSYVGRGAGINQRTVNETAAVVAYLNTLP